jgi:predicted SprT family Zn-dependent metalloprotease
MKITSTLTNRTVAHFIDYVKGGYTLEITKTRTTRYKILHVDVDAFTFDEHWRRIRGESRYKGFECYACDKHFKNGDRMGLIFTDKGNRVVCQECAKEIAKELAKEGLYENQG